MTTEHVPPLTSDEIDSLSEIPLREVPSETWQRVWRALRDHARLTQELSVRASDITRSQANELQDVLRTLAPSGVALITSARQLVELYEKQQTTLAERDAEIERLKQDEAVCHCGLRISEHTQMDNHSPVEMKLPCPNEGRAEAAEAEIERLAKCNTPFTDDIEERVVVTQHRDGYWMWEPIDGGMSTGPFSSWREAYQAGAGYFIWLEQKQKAEAAEARCRELEQQVNATDLGHVAHGLKRITELEQQVQYLNRISVQKIAAIATERDEFRQQLVAVTAERERASAEVNQLVDEIGNYEKKLAASEAACGAMRSVLSNVVHGPESAWHRWLARRDAALSTTAGRGFQPPAEARRQQERIVQLEAALRDIKAELQRRKLLEPTPKKSPLLDECLDALEAQQREIDGLYGLLIDHIEPDEFYIATQRPGKGKCFPTREQAVQAVKKAMEEKR